MRVANKHEDVLNHQAMCGAVKSKETTGEVGEVQPNGNDKSYSLNEQTRLEL